MFFALKREDVRRESRGREKKEEKRGNEKGRGREKAGKN